MYFVVGDGGGADGGNRNGKTFHVSPQMCKKNGINLFSYDSHIHRKIVFCGSNGKMTRILSLTNHQRKQFRGEGRETHRKRNRERGKSMKLLINFYLLLFICSSHNKLVPFSVVTAIYQKLVFE